MDRSYVARSARRRGELDAAVAEILLAYRAFGDVRAIYAFGSYGRGNVGPTSDLDLLVVRETTERRPLRDCDIHLAYRGAIPLDIVVVTPNEYRDILPTTSMGRTILHDAKRLDAA